MDCLLVYWLALWVCLLGRTNRIHAVLFHVIASWIDGDWRRASWEPTSKPRYAACFRPNGLWNILSRGEGSFQKVAAMETVFSPQLTTQKAGCWLNGPREILPQRPLTAANMWLTTHHRGINRWFLSGAFPKREGWVYIPHVSILDSLCLHDVSMKSNAPGGGGGGSLVTTHEV